jgi:catalase
MVFAGAGDALDDPTVVWGEDNERLFAGRLSVERIVDDPEAPGEIHVFDPMRLPDGVEPSDDPILRMRPHAYSVSAYKRLG